MKETDFKNLNFSMLGKNSSLEGDLKFSGDTLINCNVKGSITMLNDGVLTLEREAFFEGDIFCKNIEVFGKVKGSIDASGVLSVRSSADISGVINAQSLSIFPGASLNIEGHTSDSPSNESE